VTLNFFTIAPLPDHIKLFVNDFDVSLNSVSVDEGLCTFACQIDLVDCVVFEEHLGFLSFSCPDEIRLEQDGDRVKGKRRVVI
jgi:hypothetical protein